MRRDPTRTGPRSRTGASSTGASWWRERGDTTVQAIVIIPLTLLAIFATIQFAVAWYAKNALTAAAEDGLRSAQTNPATTGEPAAAASANANAGFVSTLTIATTHPAPDRLTVTVRGNVPGAFPGLTWTITGTASGPLEQFRTQGG